MQADDMMLELYDWLERASRLPARQAKRLQQHLRSVYRYANDGDINPPLDIEWTLYHAGVAKGIYEELTGQSVDD
jgi:hypothetical protein